LSAKLQYTSIISNEGGASISCFKPHDAHRTVAFPAPLEIVTFTVSSLHVGHVKTVGSFFFTTLITRLRLRPKFASPVENSFSRPTWESFKHTDLSTCHQYSFYELPSKPRRLFCTVNTKLYSVEDLVSATLQPRNLAQTSVETNPE